MKKIKVHLTIYLLAIPSLFSGCITRTEYVGCVENEKFLTQHPRMDLNGSMTKLENDMWLVEDSVVKGVIDFEKACLSHDAEFDVKMKAKKDFNKALK